MKRWRGIEREAAHGRNTPGVPSDEIMIAITGGRSSLLTMTPAQNKPTYSEHDTVDRPLKKT